MLVLSEGLLLCPVFQFIISELYVLLEMKWLNAVPGVVRGVHGEHTAPPS